MITYNNKTFIKDNKVWFPVMGEFQYSRCDSRFWNSGIAKMKALGINTIASYCFWIHHEEIEGHFNFRGNNNLRKFLHLVKDNNMLFCLRIGPWVHGECRNGGFPDWIYNKGFELRSNHKGYMEKVEIYFKELYKQCKGFMYSEGGPIYAIQVENEYSQWGKQGENIGDNHINALIKMLKKIGFDVPVYFATGWGQAACGNAIPVWGCYAEAPWENSKDELPPQEGYLISSNPNDSNIGSDTGKKLMDADITKSKYPYATVEIGSGIQVTLTRRPIIKGVDAENLVLCKLASGVTAIGYYVFHGGMNPIGALSTMQEYLIPGRNEGGFNCDLPVINYDFQGGISQYGKITDVGKHLKLYNYFAEEFGEDLAVMDTFLPKDNCKKEDDFESLRYSVRHKDKSGFVFLNNFVRHYTMPDRNIKDFEIKIKDNSFAKFHLVLKNGESAIYPVNMKTPDGVINFINATPLCKLNNKNIVFWKNQAELTFKGDKNALNNIIVLEKEDAVNGFKFTKDNKDYLFITNGGMFEEDGKIKVEFSNDLQIKVFPHFDMPEIFEKKESQGIFEVYTLKHNKKSISYKITIKEENKDFSVFNVKFDEKLAENYFVKFFYQGNILEVYMDNELIADDYFTARPYEIAIKNHGITNEFDVKVYKLCENDFVYLEEKPNFVNGAISSLDKIEIEEITTVEI